MCRSDRPARLAIPRIQDLLDPSLILHAPAHFAVAQIIKSGAIAAAATEIGLEHRVAAIGEKLDLIIITQLITNAEGATMRMDDQRQVLRIAPLGKS